VRFFSSFRDDEGPSSPRRRLKLSLLFKKHFTRELFFSPLRKENSSPSLPLATRGCFSPLFNLCGVMAPRCPLWRVRLTLPPFSLFFRIGRRGMSPLLVRLQFPSLFQKMGRSPFSSSREGKCPFSFHLPRIATQLFLLRRPMCFSKLFFSFSPNDLFEESPFPLGYSEKSFSPPFSRASTLLFSFRPAPSLEKLEVLSPLRSISPLLVLLEAILFFWRTPPPVRDLLQFSFEYRTLPPLSRLEQNIFSLLLRVLLLQQFFSSAREGGEFAAGKKLPSFFPLC